MRNLGTPTTPSTRCSYNLGCSTIEQTSFNCNINRPKGQIFKNLPLFKLTKAPCIRNAYKTKLIPFAATEFRCEPECIIRLRGWRVSENEYYKGMAGLNSVKKRFTI